MVGKFIAWLLRKAGYEVRRIEDSLPVLNKYLALLERVTALEKKYIELDSVICATMECVEEIRDVQQADVPTKQSTENVFGEMLTEYLYGYQQKRSDDE